VRPPQALIRSMSFERAMSLPWTLLEDETQQDSGARERVAGLGSESLAFRFRRWSYCSRCFILRGSRMLKGTLESHAICLQSHLEDA
jgi:hypothetical protein